MPEKWKLAVDNNEAFGAALSKKKILFNVFFYSMYFWLGPVIAEHSVTK